MNNTSQRIEWIDLSKSIAIYLVVLGHTLRTDISLVYIYGFHMPLFFFLSGLVFNESKYQDIRKFLISRFNTLVIPYVFFYLLTYLYWLLVERNYRPINLEWWQPLIGMLQGSQAGGLMDHNGILWFLPCLFSTELIYVLVNKIKRKGIQFIITVSLFFLGFCIKPILPWCINIAMVVHLFFWSACKIKTYIDEYVCKNTILAMLCLWVVYVILQHVTHNRVNIATCIYGNPLVFIVSSFIAITALSFLCKMLSCLGGG